MARFTVVLDACVLVPIALTDTLLRVAERGLYRPLWSERILNEATVAVCQVHPNIDTELINKRFKDMSNAFEDALVVGWEALELTHSLPDPNDRHVLAVALRGRADSIVTANTRDYPVDILEPLSIDIIHPDDFLLDQLDLAPRLVLEILREQAEHTNNPKFSPVDLIARLARSGAPKFADEIGRLI